VQFEKIMLFGDKQKMENYIFNIVNSVAFFDEVVMRAFREKLMVDKIQSE
jgi:hypothetical protein